MSRGLQSTTARPSIRQVADLARVSPMTVSNVLRGVDARTSQETRERVLRAAREMNYIPVAQPSVQKRRIETRIIGVVFDGQDFNGHGVPSGYIGMRAAAEDHDYDLLTLRHRRPPNWSQEREEIRFLDGRCDGFVFIVPINRYGLMETLVRHGVPVVSCGVDDVPPGVGYVVADNGGVMRQAVEHLVEFGHRRIGHLAGPRERSFFKGRQSGFRAAMADAGLEGDRACLVDEGDGSAAANQMALSAARGEITAVACANDHYALALWEQAEAMGLRVPRDLSIVGVDDVPEASRRGLTTFLADSEATGHATIDAAAAALGGGPPWQKSVPFAMMPRDSVAEPREH